MIHDSLSAIADSPPPAYTDGHFRVAKRLTFGRRAEAPPSPPPATAIFTDDRAFGHRNKDCFRRPRCARALMTFTFGISRQHLYDACGRRAGATSLTATLDATSRLSPLARAKHAAASTFITAAKRPFARRYFDAITGDVAASATVPRRPRE